MPPITIGSYYRGALMIVVPSAAGFPLFVEAARRRFGGAQPFGRSDEGDAQTSTLERHLELDGRSLQD